MSVYGTGCIYFIGVEDFLGSLITITIVAPEGLTFCQASASAAVNQPIYLCPLTNYSVSWRMCHYSVSPCLIYTGNGILTIFPSDVPFRVVLRSRLTLIRLTLIRNPGACGVRGYARIVVTYAYIFFSKRSNIPRSTSSPLVRMLPYHSNLLKSTPSAV